MARTRAALRVLHDELIDLHGELTRLLEQQWRSHAYAAAVASFLQVHAADLKSIVAVRDRSCLLLRHVADAGAGYIDIMLALLEAGAVPDERVDLYYRLLEYDNIYDLNGDDLDDAGIARRLQIMHDVHGVRMPPAEYMSLATISCIEHDRLECLRVMIEIDPYARGYTMDGYTSLLHIAAECCKSRIVRWLLENGWSLTGVDLNYRGMTPIGYCLLPYRAPDKTCDTLDALLRDVEDAPSEVRRSGLCDGSRVIADPCVMPPAQIARMITYMCAAVRAHSCLPRCVLNCYRMLAVLKHSPTVLRALPLDEHVHTGIGDPIYLNDSLRVASSFASAARYAAAVDALCIVETTVNADPERWGICMRVLRTSSEPAVTGASPTLRCWAWMRRLHAVTARQHMLRREAAWRVYRVAMN